MQLDRNNLKMQRVNKSSIIITVNTLIIIAIVILFYKDSIKVWQMGLAILGSFITHIIIYYYQKGYN